MIGDVKMLKLGDHTLWLAYSYWYSASSWGSCQTGHSIQTCIPTMSMVCRAMPIVRSIAMFQWSYPALSSLPHAHRRCTAGGEHWLSDWVWCCRMERNTVTWNTGETFHWMRSHNYFTLKRSTQQRLRHTCRCMAGRLGFLEACEVTGRQQALFQVWRISLFTVECQSCPKIHT